MSRKMQIAVAIVVAFALAVTTLWALPVLSESSENRLDWIIGVITCVGMAFAAWLIVRSAIRTARSNSADR